MLTAVTSNVISSYIEFCLAVHSAVSFSQFKVSQLIMARWQGSVVQTVPLGVNPY